MKAFIYTIAILFLFLQGKGQILSQTASANFVGANNKSLWTNLNPESLRYDDGNIASTQKLIGTQETNFISLNDFQFNIPLTATIQNLKIEIRKYKSGGIIRDTYVSFFRDGRNYGLRLEKPDAWPDAETSFIYSEPASGNYYKESTAPNAPYLWTPADINSYNFSVAIDARRDGGDKPSYVFLEMIKVTVEYTIPTVRASLDNKNQTLTIKGKRSIEIRALPNQVVVTTPTAGKYSLLITDIRGLPLEQKIFYANENSPTIVPLKNKLNGVYLITCTGNGTTKTIKSFLQ